MRIRRQFEQIEQYLREFLDSRRRGQHVYVAERAVQLLLQSLLDLGAMLSTFLGEAKPDTYRGIAKYLSRKLSLNPDEAGFLESLAGFRNILIHGYATIDRDLEDRAFSEIEKRLPRIVKRIGGIINNLEVDPPEALKQLTSIFEKHGVNYALIYGSTARRGAGRDYDIAVSAEIDSGLELGRLLVDVAEALGIHEDKVDLVHIESAPKHLIHTIIIEGKLIYGKPDEAYFDLTKHYLEYLDLNETPKASR